MASIPDYIGSTLYAICALVALLPVRDKMRQGHPGKPGWILVALFLFALVPLRLGGVEEVVRDALREIIRADYDYRARGAWQAPLAAAAFTLAALVAGFFVLWRGMDLRRPVNLAITGVFAMACLWLLRILSFHPIDRLIYAGPGPLRVNYLLELSCLGCVALGSYLYFDRPRQKQRRPRR